MLIWLVVIWWTIYCRSHLLSLGHRNVEGSQLQLQFRMQALVLLECRQSVKRAPSMLGSKITEAQHLQSLLCQNLRGSKLLKPSRMQVLDHHGGLQWVLQALSVLWRKITGAQLYQSLHCQRRMHMRMLLQIYSVEFSKRGCFGISMAMEIRMKLTKLLPTLKSYFCKLHFYGDGKKSLWC